MFEQLREAWHKATHPFEGFMEELWELWKRDVGGAILLARKSWQSLPEEVIRLGATLEAQAQSAEASNEIDTAVNRALGSLGIFGGTSSSGTAMNPDQALFIITMAGIRAHGGDPPGMPGMDCLALGVLRGQIDPIQALFECTPPASRPQFAVALQMAQMAGMPQVLQIIRITAIIQAATSLPRDQIKKLSEVRDLHTAGRNTGADAERRDSA